MLRNSTSPGYQVKDQDDQRYNKQEMDQAAGNVKTEPEKPQDYENYEDCPQHLSLSNWRCVRDSVPSRAHASSS
jgi:hypothetical protein